PAPAVHDVCDASSTLPVSDATTAGSWPQAHSLTLTLTATDHCGNHASCSQTVTVVDTHAPSITCAGPQTIECPATPSFPAPAVHDDCDTRPKPTFSDATTPGSCPQAYSVTRTWTATDHC